MFAEIVGLGIVSSTVLHYVREQNEVEKAIDSIPIRIHVNGIRGKTSVTRMIGSVLRPHYRTVTKTTGSEPKIIHINGDEELIKREGLVSIKEQINVLKMAKRKGAECIVFECMAIEPELQRILEEKVMKSSIGVITNIRYDHEDVMGESLEEIAKSLSNTIPYNGHLVVTKDVQCVEILESVAMKRNTIMHYADVDSVPEGYAQKFDFMNFDENIALVLEVANILKLDRKCVLKDMLATKHDIGRGALYMRTVNGVDGRIGIGGRAIYFLNSFANNDAQSLVKMLSQIKYVDSAKKIGLLSHRDDRIRRTMGMMKFICDYGFDVIVISSNSTLIEEELIATRYKGQILTIPETGNFIDVLMQISDKKNNYWIGLANIKTPFAESVLSYFGVV